MPVVFEEVTGEIEGPHEPQSAAEAGGNSPQERAPLEEQIGRLLRVMEQRAARLRAD